MNISSPVRPSLLRCCRHRWLRRRGSRFATEQTLIEKWLAGVTAGTKSDWQLGHEIALCGRLIKG